MSSLARTIIVVILIMLLIGSFPLHGYGMGYYGEGGIGAALLVLIILILAEKL